MKLGTNGVVINEHGEVLLIQRDDSRTFAPPGGGIDAGELPTENVAREVLEETGLKVMPVRLVGVYHTPVEKIGILNFVFRCIPRGGEVKTSKESLLVGYYPTNNLPGPMDEVHRERLERAFTHNGGAPFWMTHQPSLGYKIGRAIVTQGIYRWRDFNRKRRGEPVFVPSPDWKIGAFTVIRNEKGEVLWVKRGDVDFWNLPGGGGLVNEAPWKTAVRETKEETALTVTLTDLTSVHVYENEAHVVLTFTADIESGELTTGSESEAFAWSTPGEEPENSFEQHRIRVADAVSDDEVTQFRYQKIKSGNTESTE
jgi:ADP-ribose pyrophosphatase YjhB (NUDIX family)